MKIYSACLVLVIVVFSTAVEAKLYKWVDDKGVTHYGEVIPPEYANKSNTLLSDKGRLIKRNEEINNTERRANEEDEAKKRIDNEAKLEQSRKDKALLNTFSNEKEIDLARDRNLHQVESLISSIQSLQKSARESLKNYQQEAEERKRAGKKLHASLQADITESENKLAKLQLDLVKAQEKAASVKASYEADKLRFRELNGSAKK
jgi:chromosome segregation ATPase